MLVNLMFVTREYFSIAEIISFEIPFAQCLKNLPELVYYTEANSLSSVLATFPSE
jgi:hypothetical protein